MCWIVQGLNPGKVNRFFSSPIRPDTWYGTQRPTQAPTHWVLGFFSANKAAGTCEVHHSRPSSAEVPLYAFMARKWKTLPVWRNIRAYKKPFHQWDYVISIFLFFCANNQPQGKFPDLAYARPFGPLSHQTLLNYFQYKILHGSKYVCFSMMAPEVLWNHCTIEHSYYQFFLMSRNSDDLILTEHTKLFVFHIQSQGLRKSVLI